MLLTLTTHPYFFMYPTSYKDIPHLDRGTSMERDTARGLYKEVCIKCVFRWLVLAHSGKCLKAWESNLAFMQTP